MDGKIDEWCFASADTFGTAIHSPVIPAAALSAVDFPPFPHLASQSVERLAAAADWQLVLQPAVHLDEPLR